MNRIRYIPLISSAQVSTKGVRRELNQALVPFTGEYEPKPAFARQCVCGSWVLDSDRSCVWCGDAPPGRDPTRVWTP